MHMRDNDFHSARHWAQELLSSTLDEGSVAVDATMGNGHDTLYLAERVGENGRVYAFDIQPDAVERTRARLAQAGRLERASLFCMSHADMADVVHEQVDAVLFNFGWLPGGDHAVTTRTESSLKAVEQARALLKPGGVMTLCIYPGHEEGDRERAALLDWGRALDPKRYDVMVRAYLNQPNHPPLMLAVRRRG